MKPRKIAVVSEARATYGYIKNVMHLIERSEAAGSPAHRHRHASVERIRVVDR